MAEKFEENIETQEGALVVKLKLGEETIHELMVSHGANSACQKRLSERAQTRDPGVPPALLSCQFPLRVAGERAQ